MKRPILLLAAALAGIALSLGLSSPAQGQDALGFSGTLRHDDTPVAGVTLTVTDETGNVVDETESGADGTWKLAVESAGTYTVTLDESTLPDGLLVRNARPALTVDLPPASVRTVLFPLGTELNPGVAPAPSPGDDSGSTTPPAKGEHNDEATVVELESATGTSRFGSLLVSGIYFGLMIALAALGLSLIFGTTGLTNFSHGDLVTFGAAMAFLINVTFDLPILIAIVGAVALGGLFGWAQDWGFWSRLRKRSMGLISMMIISIGVALLIRFGVLYFLGGDRQRYRSYVAQEPWDLGWVMITPKVVYTSLIALLIVAAVGWALVYTRFGKAVRAVADNPSLAASAGINVDAIIRMVWTLGGALAALAGVFLGLNEGVKFDMGQHILLLIFAAVILGGLGTAFGAFVGALIIGVFVQLSTLVIPSELKYVGALAILIAIMLIRPQGILGRRERIG